MTDFQWADQLINREADVLFAGVTHTLQREIREVSLMLCLSILLSLWSLASNPWFSL